MIPTIETLELQRLASGDRLALQVYKYIGSQPGRKTYIQANLHGAEIVGNGVIYRLIEWLGTLSYEQLTGEIWLVPVCNPVSTNQRSHAFSSGRYNSYDGKDWNRIFWDFEKEAEDLDAFARTQRKLAPEVVRQNYLELVRAAFQSQVEQLQTARGVPYHQLYRTRLQALCLDANDVIDIHSSSNQCLDYLYCFHTREASAKYFGIDLAVLMTEYDGHAFDEAFLKPWLALERALERQGRRLQLDVESWTLELGNGMQVKPESVEKGVRGIQSYLAAKGAIAPSNFAPAVSSVHFIRRQQIRKYYAPTGGTLQNRLDLGTPVRAGDRLYQILQYNKTGELPSIFDVAAESDGFIFDRSTNQSVNQGEYVLTVVATDPRSRS